MKKLLIILAAVALAGCSVFVDVSAGGQALDKDEGGFVGKGPVMRAAVTAERDYGNRVTGYCEFYHISSAYSGKPFNDIDETWVNVGACGARVKVF